MCLPVVGQRPADASRGAAEVAAVALLDAGAAGSITATAAGPQGADIRGKGSADSGGENSEDGEELHLERLIWVGGLVGKCCSDALKLCCGDQFGAFTMALYTLLGSHFTYSNMLNTVQCTLVTVEVMTKSASRACKLNWTYLDHHRLGCNK